MDERERRRRLADHLLFKLPLATLALAAGALTLVLFASCERGYHPPGDMGWFRTLYTEVE